LTAATAAGTSSRCNPDTPSVTRLPENDSRVTHSTDF
jgi:hypothetical protein